MSLTPAEPSASRAVAEGSCHGGGGVPFYKHCDCRLDDNAAEDCQQTCVPCVTDQDCAGAINFGATLGLVTGGTCYHTLSEECEYCSEKCDETTTTTTYSTKDPHLAFAHGGRADFKGLDRTWYNLVSAKNASFNVLFEHSDFNNKNRLVHGSAMTGLAAQFRSSLTGSLVTVEFNASSVAPYRAVVRQNGNVKYLAQGGEPSFKFENLQVSVSQKKYGTKGHGLALTVGDGRWECQAWSKPYPNPASNPGKALLDIKVSALYDADHDIVAPHGLIGQSYDGDTVAVDGAQDDYTGREVTTKAMGEGAIEGDAADYAMADKFTTQFKYSRFDAVSAKPRNVALLSGRKTDHRMKGAGPIGASADVTEDLL